MTNVTNLRTFRKQKAREDQRVAASESAAKHGVSKAERVRAVALEEMRQRSLDAHQIEEE